MVNNEFAPYIQDIRYLLHDSRYAYKIDNLSITFSDLGGDEKTQKLGHCNMMFTDDPEIVIDHKSYYELSPTSRYFLMLHEGAHCLCNRFHTAESRGFVGFFENILFKLGIAKKKGFYKDGCPMSLMHPYEMTQSCMLDHFMEYIKEFQQGCK